jgi:hypothetical protein
MAVPITLLLAALALAYLSVFDRMSTVALSLVEVESQFGFPFWPVFALGGVGLLIARLIHARPKVRPAVRPPTRDAARTGAGLPAAGGAGASQGGSWLEAIRQSAKGVSDDPMGKVRFDDAAGVPIVLVLTAVTREQARRRVSSYAAWLATIPAPPAARIRVVSSPDLQGPLHGLFRGELAKHFAAEAFTVSSIHDGADVVFAWPDPRWSA